MPRNESTDETTDDGVGAKLSAVGERVLGERPTMEHVLLVLFLLAGLYMYLGADEFSPAAQTFPQMMAGATVALSALLLARNYLAVAAPVLAAIAGAYFVYSGATGVLAGEGGIASLVVGIALVVSAVAFRERLGSSTRTFIAEPMQMLGDDDLASGVQGEESEDESSEGETDSGAMYVYEIDDWRGPVVTGALCVGYMVLTYTIGMLYATPVFVAAWTVWARMEVGRAAALVGLSLATAYVFYDVIQSDIAQGWRTGWRPMPPDEVVETLVEILPILVGVVG
ncbi:hypothetical protein [Natronorarus salvus]|uniref:hypothetical protein n=1 Tax=Natronorarus salvus TaxID=3117733 RepID=UPI002F26A486